MRFLLVYLAPIYLGFLVLGKWLYPAAKGLITGTPPEPDAGEAKRLPNRWNRFRVEQGDQLPSLFESMLGKVGRIAVFLCYAPILILYGAFLRAVGLRAFRRLEVNLLHAWEVVLLAVSIRYSQEGNSDAGYFIALLVGCGVAANAFLLLTRTKGILLIATMPYRQVRLWAYVEWAFVLMGAFGCGYYAVSAGDQGAFTKPFGLEDSFYFSVITAGTVGYGDIAPVSSEAKSLVISEVVTFWTYALLVVSAVVSRAMAGTGEDWEKTRRRQTLWALGAKPLRTKRRPS